MSQQTQTENIRKTVKYLLKKHKYTYADLSKALGLTETSVKRLMTNGEFTLKRLETISQWFGLSLYEFLEISQKTEMRPSFFNDEQESFLANNPKSMYALLLLSVGFEREAVQKKMKLSKSEFHQIAFKLDKLNLIELLTNDRIRISLKGPFKMQTNGKISKMYYGKWAEVVSSLIDKDNPSKDQLLFELYMTPKLKSQMQDEFEQLLKKYRGLSRLESEISPVEELISVTGIMMVHEYDSWAAVTMDPRVMDR